MSRLFWQAVLAALAAALVAAVLPAAAATTQPFAPLDQPGPPLDVPAAALASALTCTTNVASATRDPILLVPGTNLEPGPNFAWNYERAFAARQWPFCTISLPYRSMGDIQTAGEYLVYAIRAVAARSHRQVDVVGYSQGGMVPRWALRFWPDTRPLVHSLVALDPSNHGTLDAQVGCQVQCPPAYWQQATDAHFLAALNSRAETFAGIDYTVIYSRTDEVVTPNTSAAGSSALHTGGGRIANIAVQQICPLDVSDHLAMGTYDPVGYALVMDALTHGLANPARIPASVCTEVLSPAVDAPTFPVDYAAYLAYIGWSATGTPLTSAEPPLASYVYARG